MTGASLEHRRSQSLGGFPPWPVLPDVMALVRELAFCPLGTRSGLGMGLLLVGAPKAGHTVGPYGWAVMDRTSAQRHQPRHLQDLLHTRAKAAHRGPVRGQAWPGTGLTISDPCRLLCGSLSPGAAVGRLRPSQNHPTVQGLQALPHPLHPLRRCQTSITICWPSLTTPALPLCLSQASPNTSLAPSQNTQTSII